MVALDFFMAFNVVTLQLRWYWLIIDQILLLFFWINFILLWYNMCWFSINLLILIPIILWGTPLIEISLIIVIIITKFQFFNFHDMARTAANTIIMLLKRLIFKNWKFIFLYFFLKLFGAIRADNDGHFIFWHNYFNLIINIIN